MISSLKMKGRQTPVDAFTDAGMWAVELLILLAVICSEFNNEFKLSAVETCVGRNFPTAASKDLLQERCALGKKATPPAPVVSISEPSTIAVAPHLTHSITSASQSLFRQSPSVSHYRHAVEH